MSELESLCWNVSESRKLLSGISDLPRHDIEIFTPYSLTEPNFRFWEFLAAVNKVLKYKLYDYN